MLGLNQRPLPCEFKKGIFHDGLILGWFPRSSLKLDFHPLHRHLPKCLRELPYSLLTHLQPSCLLQYGICKHTWSK